MCAVIAPVMQRKEAGWGGDGALTVNSEQTHLSDLCLCV